MSEVKEVYAKNRKEWRNWLRYNHKREKKAKLISYKKHTKKPSLSHRESIEEAICFGWIDTTVKKIDDERYSRTFVRRNKNSRWSTATLGYAKQLIKEKKMCAEGFKAYEAGLKKPVIDHGLSKNPETPEVLKKALSKNKKAKENFNKFAPSYRRFYIYWIVSAKRKETIEKRVKVVVQRSEENKKPGI